MILPAMRRCASQIAAASLPPLLFPACGSALELFPTLVTLTGAELPARHYDGKELFAG
jgi:hypothetical protein